MAYADYGFDIYTRLKAVLISGVGRVEIVNRHLMPTLEDECEFVYKFKRGIAIRLNSDTYNDEASDAYNERIYIYVLRCFVVDSDEDQQGIIDFAESVKYTLEQNKNDSSDNWQHIKIVNIDYALQEEMRPLKFADIEIEVLKDG